MPRAIAEFVAEWRPELREEWEERAAIIEYSGGESRDVAERMAYAMLRHKSEWKQIKMELGGKNED